MKLEGTAARTQDRLKRELRQICATHQVTVAFAGRAAAFIESPDHETLTATAVPRGKYAFDIGRIFLELGFDISAGIAFNRERLEKGLFGTKKTHREQHQLNRTHLFGPGNFFG